VIKGLSPAQQDVMEYRGWLRGLVGELAPLKNESLFEAAWDIDYEPTVPNDINRCHDGVDLRARYVHETSNSLPALGPCKMLEFLVALAIRLNEADYDPEYPDKVGVWFWTLMQNLEIIDLGYDEVVTAFNNINLRDYAADGYGGLFPLERPREDQRDVEIWYQMQAYLLENRY